MAMLGVSLDIYDVMKGIVLLIVTSGFSYAILEQFDSSKLCYFARLIQSAVIFLLSFIFDSAFGIVIALIEAVIGFGDYIAYQEPSLAFLDPNKA
ncbi:hypothetical protein [Acidianus bottle-shaped virus 3 strain ABV3]|uniref:Uncharacterized protein n=1 Tax=Acidianus bottle-shaped virus 3 strain ABV3 TaxID=1732174 RepID=A0A0N9NJL2_9VIRU|nr:hypothetical protein AVU00_gp44 [Acidianus bottle-shaped virus 3 strain ABV3]ALG96846.1 hypothetical protein [Acidianus bottle-shaped virus 3 strain ABV3]